MYNSTGFIYSRPECEDLKKAILSTTQIVVNSDSDPWMAGTSAPSYEDKHQTKKDKSLKS